MSEGPVVIKLTPPKFDAVEFEITGRTDLLNGALPEKISNPVKTENRRKKPVKGNLPMPEDEVEPTDPEDVQFQKSLYHLPDGTFGFPTSAIQAACSTYIQRFEPINPKYARDSKPVFYGATFMADEMVQIICSNPPYKRHDIARNSRGKRIDVYRGAFKNWKLRFVMQYNPNVITLSRLVNALNAAGQMVGIGPWRPECAGRFGRFTVTKITKLEREEPGVESDEAAA